RNDRGLRRVGVGPHRNNLVGDAPEKKIAPLTAHVRGGRDHAARELPLYRRGVLIHTLRNRVLVRVGPRLIGAIVRVVDEIVLEYLRVDRNAPPESVELTRSLSTGWI